VSESRAAVAERGGGADSGSRRRGRHRVVGQWAVMADVELSFWGYQGDQMPSTIEKIRGQWFDRRWAATQWCAEAAGMTDGAREPRGGGGLRNVKRKETKARGGHVH
jgi:hypothetical protein